MQIKGIMKRSLLIGFLETLYLNIIFGLCIPLKNSEITTFHHFKPQARNCSKCHWYEPEPQPRWRLASEGTPWQEPVSREGCSAASPSPARPQHGNARHHSRFVSPAPAETPEWGARIPRRVNAVPCQWSQQTGWRWCISAPTKPFFWLSVFILCYRSFGLSRHPWELVFTMLTPSVCANCHPNRFISEPSRMHMLYFPGSFTQMKFTASGHS